MLGSISLHNIGEEAIDVHLGTVSSVATLNVNARIGSDNHSTQSAGELVWSPRACLRISAVIFLD